MKRKVEERLKILKKAKKDLAEILEEYKSKEVFSDLVVSDLIEDLKSYDLQMIMAIMGDGD